jgi:hypothetical protein
MVEVPMLTVGLMSGVMRLLKLKKKCEILLEEYNLYVIV